MASFTMPYLALGSWQLSKTFFFSTNEAIPSMKMIVKNQMLPAAVRAFDLYDQKITAINFFELYDPVGCVIGAFTHIFDGEILRTAFAYYSPRDFKFIGSITNR